MLLKIVIGVVILVGIGLAFLLGLRWFDARADALERARLIALQEPGPKRFDPAMVADLPEPARRFFGFAITPGTALRSVAEIEMGGEISLGSRDAPDYQAMRASQVLASPHGFVWQVTLAGPAAISGTDAGGWTRFRVLGLLPVARISGDEDHRRSAYGRYVAESVFWTPAAVLPGPGITWQGLGPDTARVTVRHGALAQAVDLKIAPDGRPIAVWFSRWSNENPDRVYRLQPFGGTLSEYREVQGFRLPFRVEAGNHFGTDEYFAFYKADVREIRFPEAGAVR
ncbi:MAG: DUF6544 family protein [Burkholderiaceae bacterium]